LNDFQTPPKKSVNSIAFMHSFPLPGVFLKKHKVFYNHSQTDTAMIEHFSTFVFPCPSHNVQSCPHISGCSSRSLLFQSHVHDTGNLPWPFAGCSKAIRWNVFLALSCYVLLNLGRPYGIIVLAAGRVQPKRILEAGNHATQRRSGPDWETN